MGIENPVFMTMITTIGTVLITCIGYLFKLVMNQSKEQVKQAERQSEFKQEMGELRGNQNGVTKMADETLRIVHDAVLKRDEIIRELRKNK